MRIIDLEAQIQQTPYKIHKQQGNPDVARGEATRASVSTDDILRLANVAAGAHMQPQQMRESLGFLEHILHCFQPPIASQISAQMNQLASFQEQIEAPQNATRQPHEF